MSKSSPNYSRHNFTNLKGRAFWVNIPHQTQTSKKVWYVDPWNQHWSTTLWGWTSSLKLHSTTPNFNGTINFRENFQHFTATYFSIKFDHPNKNGSHLPSREQIYLIGTSKIINTKLPFNGICDKFPVEGKYPNPYHPCIWYIYIRLAYLDGKSGEIYHAWMLLTPLNQLLKLTEIGPVAPRTDVHGLIFALSRVGRLGGWKQQTRQPWLWPPPTRALDVHIGNKLIQYFLCNWIFHEQLYLMFFGVFQTWCVLFYTSENGSWETTFLLGFGQFRGLHFRFRVGCNTIFLKGFTYLTWTWLRCLEKVKTILPNSGLMVIYHGTTR